MQLVVAIGHLHLVLGVVWLVHWQDCIPQDAGYHIVNPFTVFSLILGLLNMGSSVWLGLDYNLCLPKIGIAHVSVRVDVILSRLHRERKDQGQSSHITKG